MADDFYKILLALKAKRLEIASLKKVEAFKIFHNSTLEEIAKTKPQTVEELAKIKGMGGSKLLQYGEIILGVIHGFDSDFVKVQPLSLQGMTAKKLTSAKSKWQGSTLTEKSDFSGRTLKKVEASEKTAMSVSEFLGHLNGLLATREYQVAGEISEFKLAMHSVYFSLKDKKDESVVNCYMSRWKYESLGTQLAEGMEVLVSGYPEIYKPSGRLSLIANNIEPIGEGALRKAYELLKRKLETEGLFARKRPLPEFIQRIGVISSRNGVVIQDFKKNLKNRGYQIEFYDARVEGVEAVSQLVAGINLLSKRELDVLVVIRGGGSLESMQAFNNERVARAMFASPIPTICGIGHDVDVPIACLVADNSASTPTATAHVVNRSWERLEISLPVLSHRLMNLFEFGLITKLNLVNNFYNKATGIVRQLSIRIQRSTEDLATSFKRIVETTTQKVSHAEKILSALNPENQLRLGYSILFDNAGKVLKSIDSIAIGDMIKARLQEGTVVATVRDKNGE